MSIRHHTHSRLMAFIEARASDRMLAYAQRTEDALTIEREIRRDLEARHRKALDDMRAEYDSARDSIARELDIEIELSRRLGERCGIGFAGLCALRVEVQDDFDAQDLVAGAEALLSRAFSEQQHPSNGEAS